MPRFRPLSLLSTAVLLAGMAVASRAQEVIIYRCLGPKGQLTLRDSPCEKGETQQTRSMQRPRDPAPVAAPTPVPVAPTPAREPANPPPVRVVYATPPRPMYECVSADGKRYTSDSGEGNPRWVPFWTLGYPRRPRHDEPGPRPPDRPPTQGPHPPRAVVVPFGGGWVRDECHPLPQAEVCARLSDRRYEILRRYGSAMPSERRALDLEQRGIDARMANDCGNP